MNPTAAAPTARSVPPPDPRLWRFFPLVYVAWADGDLADSELALIARQMRAAGGDDAGLAAWLDPDTPPSAAELHAMLSEVRVQAARVPEAARTRLSRLGLAIAEAHGDEPQAAEVEALLEVERALGLDGSEFAASLLADERPIAPLPEAGEAFAVDAMTRLLDGEERDVRNRVRRLLADDRFRLEFGLDAETYRSRVLEWLGILADEGLGGLSVPPQFGGGGDPAGFLSAFETLGYFDLSLLVKFGVQFGLFGGAIQQLGSERHHRLYLRDMASLDLLGCFAMTETGHGSNVHDLETVARFDRDADEFVLITPRNRARKDYIGNAARDGRMAVVFAQLEIEGERFGVHAFLAPIRDEDGEPAQGVTIEDCGHKLGLNGVDNGRLWFDSVRIPRANLLDRFASVGVDGEYESPIASPGKRFFTMLGTLVGGRVAVASGSLSATKVAQAIAVRYAERRRQFGPAGEPERLLLDYRTHQRRLIPGLAVTYGLNFALHDLQRQFVHGGADHRRIEADAAGLKAYATWHATATIQECREACGGQGYLAENRFGALKADTDVFTTFEGDNTVLMQLLAKDLLTGFGHQFGRLRVLGMARWVAGRAAHAVSDKNPIATRRTGTDHLRDPDFQMAALEARKDELVTSLARRIKHRVDNGMSSFDALVDCQNHAMGLAHAQVEWLILNSFRAAEGRAERSSVAETLERVRSLYVLEAIERDRAWFFEQGYIEPSKSKAIRDLVTGLCEELRPAARSLVDAFAVPESCLAPIALPTGAGGSER